MTELETKLLAACKTAENYLVERGIEVRGVVGRTQVLPQLREAILAAQRMEQRQMDQRVLESD